ncbi:MAG: DEAD/DEAH box helicase [Phycisphaerales bacterium]|nr:DEAD/DEAH box helicase [Phycisphaerales bacterium]
MTDIFETDKSFADLGLSEAILKGVTRAGFDQPTVIQARLIPAILAGRDALGQAKTGTGKTAAFGLPLLQMCDADERHPQALVLVPTRELAIQVAGELADLGRGTDILTIPIYGGGSIRQQAEKLKKGRHFVVGTPGRLMDMHQRGLLKYDKIRFVVLDEVDRMLDIGFRDDIRKILSTVPDKRQTIFVSATISSEIETLARRYMDDPVKIIATSGSLTVSQVDQKYFAVEPWDKKQLLLYLLTHEEPAMTLVFCRTKRTVDNLTDYLNRKRITTHAIHGDMYQGKRNKTIKQLREGSLSVLIASDLAARGLDVQGITHVINYDLPEDSEIYVHRIGRTARTGRHGVAWSFVTPEQGPLLTAIEVLINAEIPKIDYPDFKPGSVPAQIREDRKRDEQRSEQARDRGNRFSVSTPPVAEAEVDPTRFPGGVVPTGKPNRQLGGRVRSKRGRR